MFIKQQVRECTEFVPGAFELPKEVQQRLLAAGESLQVEVDEETLRRYRRGYFGQKARDVLQVARSSQPARLVFLGDPGSGKSTLLQYMLLEWAEKGPADALREPIPLLIELREYARLRRDQLIGGFIDYLHRGANVRWHLDSEGLRSWLQQRPSILLFDGLDEVFDPVMRREISIAIHRFADEYSRAHVIVTSRVIGYQPQLWRDEGFRHFMLQELESAQITDFLEQWHRDAYETASGAKVKHERLRRAIADSPAIRQLAGNPLLLTMMAILNRTQDLPRDRAELYEQCSRLLLHQWKVEVAFAADTELTKASLDYKDKRGLLLGVARTMQEAEEGLAGNLIDEELLESTLARGLHGVPNLRPERAARSLIAQLRGRNFMLCSVGGRCYAFVHRTLLEYFCAVDIRDRFQTEQSITLEHLKTAVYGRWADPSWHEVLCLLSGMLAPRFVAEILAWLLERPNGGNGALHVLLAGRCVAEVRKRAELGPVADRALVLLQALCMGDARASRRDDAGSLSESRYQAVRTVAAGWRDLDSVKPWLRTVAVSAPHAAVRGAAVRELARGWGEEADVLELLIQRAEFDEDVDVRQLALREAVNVSKNNSTTLDWLLARAKWNWDPALRCAAIHEIVHGWKSDPETLPWLQARLRAEPHEDVRATIVQEVAGGWKSDLETFAMLEACLCRDTSALVRKVALRELARGWDNHSRTLTMLKGCAESDENATVCASAVQEIARAWSNHAGTLSWLQDCVRSDRDPTFRGTALQELARGWRGDPQTVRILTSCATSDHDAGVRARALQQLLDGWKDKPEIMSIVKSAAASDADEVVRQSVSRAIAKFL